MEKLTYEEGTEVQAAWSEYIMKYMRKAIKAGDREQSERLQKYHIRVANKLNDLTDVTT